MFDSLILKILIDGLFAGFVSVAFAMLFAVPSRYLAFVALAGFITKALRTFLYTDLEIEIACATFLSCAVTSLVYIYIAPRLEVPRPVFTTAAIIPLVPGLDAYTCLISLYEVIEGNEVAIMQSSYLILHHGMRCFAILLSICLGIAVPPLFFYKYRHLGNVNMVKLKHKTAR